MFSFSKLILPIALLAPCINATVYLPKGITMQSVQTANIIIAWDIHNVLAIEDGTAKAGAIIGDIFPIVWTKLFDTAAWDEIKLIKKTNKDTTFFSNRRLSSSIFSSSDRPQTDPSSATFPSYPPAL